LDERPGNFEIEVTTTANNTWFSSHAPYPEPKRRLLEEDNTRTIFHRDCCSGKGWLCCTGGCSKRSPCPRGSQVWWRISIFPSS